MSTPANDSELGSANVSDLTKVYFEDKGIELIIENNLLLTVFIIAFLSLLFIAKVIWNFIKFNIWFIRVIFKPLGIAFAAWSYVFRNNTIYRR